VTCTPKSFYSVKLEDFYDEHEPKSEKSRIISTNLHPDNIEKTLFKHYYTELLGGKVKFVINNIQLDPSKFILQESEIKTCKFTTLDGTTYDA
jgi:hypothetical protein